MGVFIALFLISVPILVIGDLLWLGYFMRDFYQSRLSHLLGDINWYAAVLFYVVFVAGLTFFGTAPGVKSGSLLQSALLGGLFGFFAYATYDLTNHATLKQWPVSVTLIDIVWGALLAAFISTAAHLIYTYVS